MATTFRSGPRDPVTGATSTSISSGNIVRDTGQTDNERAARQAAAVSYEPPALRASAENALNEARYNDFLRNTGRSATNPFGNEGRISRMTGVSPDKVNYTNTLGAAGIESLNRLAYDQFLNPLDSRGRVRGMLREGSPTQYGNVYRDSTMGQQDTGGLSSLLNFLPGTGLIRGLTRGRSDLAVPIPGFFPDSPPQRYSEQERSFLDSLTGREIRKPIDSVAEVTPTEISPETLPTTSEILEQILDNVRNQEPSSATPETINQESQGPSGSLIGDDLMRETLLAQQMIADEKTMFPPDFKAKYGYSNVRPTVTPDPRDMVDMTLPTPKPPSRANPDRDRMLAFEPVVEGRPISYDTSDEALLPQTFLEFSGVPSIEDMIRRRTSAR